MLYIVATPIGNLEDITLRAIRVLKEVDVILCEDTRVTKRLLERHEIEIKSRKAPPSAGQRGRQLITYNEQRSGASIKKVIRLLEEGKDVALVSDAGTPIISDPGARLIQEVREIGAKIVAIPGANAAIAALSISGLPASDFLFLGFLPHKKGRETLFKEIAASKRTVVFYESPHRILKTLQSLDKNLMASRKIVIARELTKIYEEVISGNSKEVLDYFEKNPKKIKGEFVVMIEGV
ncbi:16S rRNA (cytidine(1402)-2'-O)-methyltransferase [bacterium]|nr:16S rRNA (cytidine(1402)-2'-O)-methyltransferase [bacterium]